MKEKVIHLLLCACSIALLFTTSLFQIKKCLNFYFSNSNAMLYDALGVINSLDAQIHSQSHKYEACVKRNTQHCYAKFQETKAREKERIDNQHESNMAKIKAMEIVIEKQRSSNNDTTNNSIASQFEARLSMVLQNETASINALSLKMKTNKKDLNRKIATFNATTKYVQDLGLTYDNCVKVNSSGCVFGESFGDLNNRLVGTIQQTFVYNIETSRAYVDNVKSRLAEMEKFVDGIMYLKQSIESVLGVPLGARPSGSVGLGSLIYATFPNYQATVNAYYKQNLERGIMRNYSEGVNAMKQQLTNVTESINTYSTILNATELLKQALERNHALTDITNNLLTTSGDYNNRFVNNFSTLLLLSNRTAEGEVFLNNARSSFPFTGANVESITQVFKESENLFNLAVSLDFVFRVVKALKLVYDHVVLTDHAKHYRQLFRPIHFVLEGKKSQTQANHANAVRYWFGSIVTFSTFTALFTVLVGFLVVYSMYSLYTPFLHSYLDGCTAAASTTVGLISNGNGTRDDDVLSSSQGTFLTKNIFALSYKLAEFNGTERLLENVKAYSNEINRYCLNETTQNEARNLELKQRWFALNVSEKESNPTLSLNYTVFNCSATACSFGFCQGPQEKLLHSIAWKAGCKVEKMFHTLFLLHVLAFVIYLCLNVSRVYLFRGVSVVVLFDETFRLTTTTTTVAIMRKEELVRHIQFVLNYDTLLDTRNDVWLQTQIRFEKNNVNVLLKERIWERVWYGWKQIFGALCFNVLWIVFTFHFMQLNKWGHLS